MMLSDFNLTYYKKLQLSCRIYLFTHWLCKLWLHDFVASSAFLSGWTLLGRERLLRFSAALPLYRPGIKAASQSSHWVHSCHTSTLGQSAGRGRSSSGCQAICPTWLLKSMTICREQVWFVHEWAETKEAINLKGSVCTYVSSFKCLFIWCVFFDWVCVSLVDYCLYYFADVSV